MHSTLQCHPSVRSILPPRPFAIHTAYVLRTSGKRTSYPDQIYAIPRGPHRPTIYTSRAVHHLASTYLPSTAPPSADHASQTKLTASFDTPCPRRSPGIPRWRGKSLIFSTVLAPKPSHLCGCCADAPPTNSLSPATYTSHTYPTHNGDMESTCIVTKRDTNTQTLCIENTAHATESATHSTTRPKGENAALRLCVPASGPNASPPHTCMAHAPVDHR